jgi:hypothetical protein
MTRYFVMTALVCACAAPAAAQSIGVPCGGVLVATNSSTQFGQQGLWLQYTVTSSIPPNLCISQTYVDAVVASVAGSAGHDQATWTASIQRQVPVPIPNLYITNGRHSYRLTATFTPVNALASQSAAVVQLYSPPPPDPVEECAANGSDWYWNGTECIFTPGSPLLIDVGGNGFKLTSVEEGVPFDIDGDGVREQVSWTARGAENAFLACDRNGNGVIDDGTELFGTATPVFDGGTAANGFEALSYYHVGGEFDGDATVSVADPIYARLLLWTDRNHNGASEPDELQTLASASVGAISLTYKSIGRRDRHGNTFRQAARLTWVDGRQSNIYDIWFRQAR